jgi:hypothetical protein
MVPVILRGGGPEPSAGSVDFLRVPSLLTVDVLVLLLIIGFGVNGGTLESWCVIILPTFDAGEACRALRI